MTSRPAIAGDCGARQHRMERFQFGYTGRLALEMNIALLVATSPSHPSIEPIAHTIIN